MPQLDTIYLFMVYLWSWTTMYLITQKTVTFKMVTDCLTNQPSPNNQTMLKLPWT
uniref:ATP synthase F0 subunit 8 n=1 Tax=Calamaria septentrionalis TaxID=1720245 RepID=UPI001FF49E52|nr:ATP synthase F0 subunit 8 [Calamaria septentrionalis]UOD77170.1 ATP synthase F0 subunit 8 [Calamaria septentrionalis]